MAKEVIREFENFTLEHITGVGNNDTPYEQLNVRSKGLAEKHVVEVRLDYRGSHEYNGEPIKYMYNSVDVSHGMRMKKDTLAETQEYINVLKEALDVAFEVQKYCILNGWWNG